MFHRWVGALVGLAFIGMAGTVNATLISITVGDDDGYGVGIPDNGNTSGFAVVGTDNRSAAEATATDGAQITDVYSAIHPGFGPNGFSVVSVFFPFAGSLTGATLTVDMADFQFTLFGPISVFFNGVLQAGLFNFDDGFQNSVVRSFVLDAAAIANANVAGQFVLGLNRSGSGDFIAFDFFRFDGIATIPEPATLALFALGLAGLGFMSRRRRNRRRQN